MYFLQLTKNFVKIVIGGTAFIGTFYTMIQFMFFLSYPEYNRKTILSSDVWLSITWSLVVNMSLLSLFMLQHSFQKNIKIYGLTDTSRSIYCIFSIAALQVLMRNWQVIPEVVIWKYNLDFSPFWWLYTIIHSFGWFIVYAGNVCMDINELLGVKQIYYSIVNLPDPNSRKSFQLQRLNAHMRHSSYLAFLMIFWIVPVMSLDRILLGSILTTYMYVAWDPDETDYAYQRTQYIRKYHELERLQVSPNSN